MHRGAEVVNTLSVLDDKCPEVGLLRHIISISNIVRDCQLFARLVLPSHRQVRFPRSPTSVFLLCFILHAAALFWC